MQKSARSKLYENYDYLSPESQSRIQQSGVLRQPDVIRKGWDAGNKNLIKRYGIDRKEFNPANYKEYAQGALKEGLVTKELPAHRATVEYSPAPTRTIHTPNLSNKYNKGIGPVMSAIAKHNPLTGTKVIPRMQNILDRHEIYETLDPKVNRQVLGNRFLNMMQNPSSITESELRKITKNQGVRDKVRAYKKNPSALSQTMTINESVPVFQKELAPYMGVQRATGRVSRGPVVVGDHNSLGVLGKESKMLQGFSYIPEARLMQDYRKGTGETAVLDAVTNRKTSEGFSKKHIKILEKSDPVTFKAGKLFKDPTQSYVGDAINNHIQKKNPALAAHLREMREISKTVNPPVWDVGKAKAMLQTANPPKPSYVDTALNKIKPVFGGLGRVKRLFGH